MQRLKKSLSLHRKKTVKTPEDDPNNKPMSWQEDEKKVREGCCSFQVKYLGFIEVFDSRGMQVCEEAIKALRRPKKKTIRAILYVSGDTIRVSDEISKGLIVDQTIEKVSFCSPDRNHQRGFAYICRDGTTRRWMCHSFLAIKETGERLSHAVGCAFAICLEKKQKRESDVTQPTILENRVIPKGGSFRQASLTERLQDPQSAIIVDFLSQSSIHVPANNTTSPNHSNAAVIPRPHASATFLSERQSSLRMFPKLQESSPFKRELSLRLAELPGSSPINRRAERSIDEERTESDGNTSRNVSSRVLEFSTFSKAVYTSDNSASGSPVHRMSASLQSESPSAFHNNPFLLSGAINYGASSTFTSQEGINCTTNQKNESNVNGTLIPLCNKVNESFQQSHVKESCTSPIFPISTNGFSNSTSNRDNLQNPWPIDISYHSNNSSYETSSTNPWCELPNPALSEFTNDYRTSQIANTNTTAFKSAFQSSTTCQSDPFDLSWINRKTGNDNNDTDNISPLSNNPFLA